jgi:hypothetical protein
VRGSSLAWPDVLATLRPFIVTSSTARTTDDLPDELRGLYREAGFRDTHVNFVLFVLDADGKLLRWLQPVIRPPQFHFDPEAQGRDFKRQLDQLLDGLPLPRPDADAKPKLTLPDVSGDGHPAGLRVYLSFAQNRLNHYRTPTVEALALSDEMKQALHYADTQKEVPVSALKPLLEQLYPPAIMDGSGGFRSITGTLKLKPAGAGSKHRYAVLEGKVQFLMDNRNRTTYACNVALVLAYPKDSTKILSLRGVAEGTVPKHNPQGQIVERIKMTAAIESRPE